MDIGGAESWLMNVLRHIDRQHYQLDFVTLHGRQGAYDDEIRRLGSRIIPCPYYHHPLRFIRDFKQILHDYGPYDIVHSHVHYYSGLVVLAARIAGTRGRIVHSHTSVVESPTTISRHVYLKISRFLIERFATLTLAVSQKAAYSLLGADWHQSRLRIHYCGIDTSTFTGPIDKLALRHELHIPPSAYTIGHVGRFEEVKNHRLILKIFAEISLIDPNVHLVLVGDGSLRSIIEQYACKLGIRNKVTFTGARPDVARIMSGALDLFLFPSQYEGMGLAVIEAQAAGIPCVVSNVIPDEAIIVPHFVHRLPLTIPPQQWAKKVMAVQHSHLDSTANHALQLVEQSPFNIINEVKELEQIYGDQL